jgi:hypothetical protein
MPILMSHIIKKCFGVTQLDAAVAGRATGVGFWEDPKFIAMQKICRPILSHPQREGGKAAFDAMSMPMHGRLRCTPDVPRAAARAFIGRFGDSLSGRGDGR